MTPPDPGRIVDISTAHGGMVLAAEIHRVLADDAADQGILSARTAAAPNPAGAFSPEHSELNLLAIGSDRTTGDCLGPLIGEYLAGTPGINVYGTLEAPVHAANLHEIAPEITGFTIAVDAALGHPVGSVCVRRGALAPGAALGRRLPLVGDVAISGLVCEPGPLGFERLRSVRLGAVRRMAYTIAVSIAAALGTDVVQSGFPAAAVGGANPQFEIPALEANRAASTLGGSGGEPAPTRTNRTREAGGPSST